MERELASIIYTPKDIFDTNTVSSVSDQLEQDYRRYAHKLDEEVIG